MNNNIELILARARQAVAKKQLLFDPSYPEIPDELMQLSIEDSSDICPILSDILEELTPKHFVSGNKHEVVFTFSSKKLRKKGTLKFAVKNGYLLYQSLKLS